MCPASFPSTREPAATWVTRRRWAAEDEEDDEEEGEGEGRSEEAPDEPEADGLSRRNSAIDLSIFLPSLPEIGSPEPPLDSERPTGSPDRSPLAGGFLTDGFVPDRYKGGRHRRAVPPGGYAKHLERATGLEPATSSLGSLHSTN